MTLPAVAQAADIRAVSAAAARRRAVVLIAAAALVAAMVTGFLNRRVPQYPVKHRITVLAPTISPAPVIPVPVVPPQVYKPLTEVDAVEENASRPLDSRPLEVARPFVLAHDANEQSAWSKAVHCLELANYYEAASEGAQGMRAVTQVVLNRVRHPSFPHSICQVVFQGAERPTGCQFTFACDGSMNRTPVPALLARARAVAVEALAGRVEPAVGMATHYHANFVVPYWADSLDKIRTLGAHIFYVWHGAAGSRAAFHAAYAGEPADPDSALLAQASLDETAQSGLASGAGPLAADVQRVNLVAASGKKAHERAYLVADERPSLLKADEAGSAGKLVEPLGLPKTGERVSINGQHQSQPGVLSERALVDGADRCDRGVRRCHSGSAGVLGAR